MIRSLSALLITSSLSIPALATQFSHHGLYVGLSGAQNTITLRTSANNKNSLTQNLTGLSGGAYLGYTQPLTKHISLALEAGLSASNASTIYDNMVDNANSKLVQATEKLSSPTTFSISLLPSYHINSRTHYFLRLAAKFMQLKKTGNVVGTSKNYSEQLTGYTAGLGVSTKLGAHMTLRGEFDDTFYPSFTISSVTAPTTTYKLYPVSQQFILGLTYHFDSDAPVIGPYTVLPSTINSALYYTYTMNKVKRILSLDGVYFGASGGISSMTFVQKQMTFVTNGTSSPTPATQYQNLDIGAFSPALHAYAGYGATLSPHFYLGLEGEFTFSNLRSETRNTALAKNWEIDKSFDAGVSIVPGYLINHSNLLYLNIGFIVGQFSRTGNYMSGLNFKQIRPGAILGGGYEFAITPHLSIRTEYDFKVFEGISKDTRTNEVINGTSQPVKVSANYSPTSNTFAMGVNYRF